MWTWDSFFRHSLEFGVILPGAVACLLPTRDYLRKKHSRVIAMSMLCSLLIMAIGASLCTFLQIPTNTVLIPLLLPMLLMCRAVCTLAWSKLLFVFFNATMLSAWGTLEASYFMANSEISNYELTLNPATAAMALVLSALVILMFGRILSIKIPRLFEMTILDKLWNWFFCMPLAVTLFFYWVLPYDFAVVTAGRAQVICLVIWFLTLVVVFAFYEFFWVTISHISQEQELKQENMLLHAEGMRYQQLQVHMQETARLRHDFRQHIRVLSELASRNNLKGLKDYLSNYSTSVQKEHLSYCENPAVDAIAAWYQHMADEKEVPIEWKLVLPGVLPVQDNDFCMILGNLLENALKASLELPMKERLVRAGSQMIGEQMLGLSVANRYFGDIVLDKRGLPVQRGREGIGLLSVSSAISKWGGTMVIDTAQGWFTVNILFHL